MYSLLQLGSFALRPSKCSELQAQKQWHLLVQKGIACVVSST